MEYIAEALRGQAVKVNELANDKRNARKHNERNIREIAQSLKEFGQQKPIVLAKDGVTVIAGNGTLAAAKRLGWEWIAVSRSNLDGRRAAAYAIADNRTAELAEWDDDMLADVLKEISEEFDPAAVGFTEKELAKLLDQSDLDELFGRQPMDDDEIPEPPANPVTKPGDLIILGRHRVLCADSTKPENVARVLDGATPFIMVTDPPYGVDYDPQWRQDAAEKGLISFASRRTGTVQNDNRADWTEAYKLFPGTVAYVWHAGRFTGTLADNLESAGFDVRSQIIWRKPSFAISRGHYHWQHEPCWYAVRKGTSSKWCGDRSQSTIWDITNRPDEKDNSNHGTQKPLECMARPIRNHGGSDDAVYDPFLGSGTTVIAAERLGRRCFGLELDPSYCDVICDRWSKATGQTPVRVRADDA